MEYMASFLRLVVVMQGWRLTASSKWLLFLSITGALTLTALYWKEDSSRTSPTEYVERQPIDPTALADNDKAEASIRRESQALEAAVENPEHTARKLSQAWNQGSSLEIASLFTSDGELTIPNGSTIRSKAEIEKTLDEKRSGLLSNTTLNSEVDEVSQLDAQTAIVRGRYQLDGIKILGFNKAASGTFVLRQLKNGRQWLISKAEIKDGG